MVYINIGDSIAAMSVGVNGLCCTTSRWQGQAIDVWAICLSRPWAIQALKCLCTLDYGYITCVTLNNGM